MSEVSFLAAKARRVALSAPFQKTVMYLDWSLDIPHASDPISPSIHRGVGRASELSNRFSGFSTSENTKRLLPRLPSVEAPWMNRGVSEISKFEKKYRNVFRARALTLAPDLAMIE